MKKTLLASLAVLALNILATAQPLPCGNPASMTSFCLDACVVCDIDGFTGINDSNISGEAPPGFCTSTVHNAQWIAFRAASTNLTLSVSVSNCASGGIGGFTGLEVGIYESLDCENFELISNCDGDIPPGTSQNFTTIAPLEIGQYYYFVMDGNDGDICTYVIDVVSGSTQVPLLSSTGPITGIFDACPGSTLTYTTPYLPAATIYEWTVNGNVVDTDTSLTYTWPGTGTYQLCVKAKNVCDEATPTCQFVTIAEIPPTVYVENLCGGDSFVVADTVLYLAGNYEFHYQTPADCDSVIQVTITAAPNQVTNLDLNICDGDTLWVGGNPYFDTGIYQENLATWLGCDSTVNLDLFVVICEIQATIGASQVQCYGGSNGVVTFSVDDGTPPFTFDWYRLGQPGPSGMGNLSGVNVLETLTGLPVGTYVINIQDAFGNDRVLLTDVGQPDPLTVIATPSVYGGGFNVSCNGGSDGSLLASAGGGLPPYSYAWSSGAATALATNLAEGDYTLTVTDNVGCTLTASYTLDQPNPLLLAALFNDPVCDGPLTGSITAQSVAGGIAPYQYSLNGSPFADSTSFTDLGEGPYTLSVQDANGCFLDSTVQLEAAIIPVLDLGENITLELGDSLRITPLIVTGAELYAWGQTPGLSCYDCPTPYVYIFHPMGYSLTVTSEDGCTASDSIFVDIHATRDVYIPNAFSPNGDGINDLFNVFGGAEVLRVQSFKVFDRWGEHVFELYDFMPNNAGIGWDGTFNGKEMQGAVFAWTAEVEFLDEVVILYKGDVMVVK
ncbi:MAG: gliding motility-associated C-terminal domain-containing protein [Saprospiraceae bacterium]|nr:gliding motility-associated C-terminal domain-containing protein [Saprospiraceae bacterium]